MNHWSMHLALFVLVVTGSALAQEAGAPAPAVPNVESVDILRQNQAERARDQPGNNAPVWRAVKEGGAHYSSLPAPEAGVLIQPRAQFPGQSRPTTAGEAWRQYRNGPLMRFGAGIILAALLAVTVLYWAVGPIRKKAPDTGRLIERFTPLERTVHWTAAISFVILAASGLVMLFGKFLLLPLVGYPLFGALGILCKNLHNFAGPVFAFSIVATFVLYVRDNLPAKTDFRWLMRLGGMLGGKEPHSGRFNAGEKIWFWGGLTVLGLVISASGFVLDMLVPGIAYTRSTMQAANIVHLVGTTLMMAGAVGHIYLGTLGMEGAYQAMRHGFVDDRWAEQHHDLWYEQVQKGEIPRVRSQQPGDESAPVKA